MWDHPAGQRAQEMIKCDLKTLIVARRALGEEAELKNSAALRSVSNL